MMKEWRTVSIFLLPVMIYMWVVSGTIIWGLIRPLSFVSYVLEFIYSLFQNLVGISPHLSLYMPY